MRLVRCIVAAIAVISLSATPASAQVDVRVKVDTKAIREAAQDVAREVQAALRTALGPELRRDLQEAVRDIAESFEEFGNLPWGSGDWSQSRNFRATQTDRETRRFNVGANGQLDLETLSGDVTIRRGSARELIVEIVREARGTTDATVKAGLAEVRAESEGRGGRVTVKAVYPNRRGRSDYSVTVSYIVSAPAGTSISTRSISGDVTVEGIDGELSVNSTSGDVKVMSATRLAKVSTVSGDITLTNVSAEGLLEASTMSGEILATNIKARRVDLGAISGGVTARGIDATDVKLHSMADDISFEGPLTSRGRYEFTSHAGDVRVTIDGRVGFTLDASTFSGSVRSDLALQNSRSGGRSFTDRREGRENNTSLSGTFGDGSAAISARSFNGEVILIKK
jgi:DUF4097 and DUF4098 domain-containing protein YvlB